MRTIVIIALVAACSLDKQPKNACTTQADCLDGYVCSAAGTCELPDECTPIACSANQCGMVDNGCGGKLECGGCPNGQECGLAQPNQCGTPPPHCTNESQDASLGETGVDCGGDCTGCPTGGGCKTTDDCAAGNTCTADVCLAGTWSTVAQLPTPRERLVALLGQDGLIYAIGGNASGGKTGLVEVYNPATNSWSTRTPMPTPRYGFAAVVGNDGRIYAMGGPYVSVNDEGPSRVAEVYNPATDQWQTLPSLPEGRFNPAAAVALDGTIYVTGGFQSATFETLSSTLKLAPGGTSWVPVTPAMTSPRSSHAMARTSDGRLYAIAGDDGSDDVTSFEYMVPGTPGWNTLPPLTYARKQHAAVVIQDRIYVTGGNAPGVAILNQTIEVYTPSTNSWSRAPDLPAGRYGHAAVTLPDGRIFIIGGRRAVIPPSTPNESVRTPLVEVLTP